MNRRSRRGRADTGGSSNRARAAALLVFLAAPVVVSCELLLDLHRLEADAPAADARAPTDPCVHALPPPPPEVDDDTSTANDYWFATQQIIVPLKDDAGVKQGVDLDNACTCMPDLHDGAASCETPSTQRQSCDFDGGVDDSIAAVSVQYSAFLHDFDLANSVNHKIQTGDRTFLVFLSGYNGKANDREVGVAIVTAGGLYDDGHCGDPPTVLPDAGRDVLLHSPRWDGCDRWSPFPNLLRGPFPKRKTTTTPAYVSNHVLVAQVQSIGADFLGESVTLNHGIAVATIVPEDNGAFRLEGFIAARLAFTDAANLVGRVDVSQPNGDRSPLCTSQFWPTVTTQLCSARDLMQHASQDFQGFVCDAVSMTMGFVARTAQVSDDEYKPPQRSVACDVSVDCADASR